MKAINYLKQIKQMDSQIYSLIEDIASYEAMATSTTSVLTADRVQTSVNPEKMADCVAKIIDEQKRLNKQIDAYINFKNEAREIMCECCDADCLKLLHMRHFQYCSWEKIAVEMNFTYKWVSGGMHQRALSQLQKGLDQYAKK